MGLKNKPSETNKDVIKPDCYRIEKPTGYRKFNSFTSNTIKHIAYSEEELYKTLKQKVDRGWHQVSDIFIEVEQNQGDLRFDSGYKKVNVKHPRNRKIDKAVIFFVYISRTEPRIKREYKKAYKR